MNKIIIIFLITSSAIFAGNDENIIISDTPAVSEYRQLFQKAASGEVDPYLLLTKIVEKGNKAISGLEEILAAPPDTAVNIQFGKVYSVLALDAIGTPQAVKILINAASGDDENVRSEIIRAFAFNQYYRVAYNDSEKVNPDKEILRILVENADDTTFIEKDNMAIGEIAREGIKNWTGEDYGELPIIDPKIRAGDGTEKNVKDYRKETWIKNNLKVKWNSETKHFEMKS